MKSRTHAIIVGMIALSIAPFANAQLLTWDANGTGTGQTDGGGVWLNANQWWNGSANQSWVSGADAFFGNGGAGGAVTLASPTAANLITFNSFSATYTLGTAGQPLTLNSGIMKTGGSGAVVFASPIILGASQAWTNNSVNALTVNTPGVTNGGFNLTIDGTGTTTFGGGGTAAVTLNGSGSLTKLGSGRFTVGGTNYGFTGSVTINGGVLQMYNDPNALGNGNVSLNGGVLSVYWGITYSRTLGATTSQVQILGGESGFAGAGATGPTINLGGTVVWGATGEGTATGYFNPSTFVLGDAGTGNAGTITFSSGLNLNGATRTISVPYGVSAGGNSSTISASITTSTGTAGLIKTGAGRLILSAANTYNGGTSVNQGVLQFSAADRIAGTGRNVSVTNGAVVAAGYAINNAFLNRLAESTNAFVVALAAGSSNALDFDTSAGALLPNARLGSVGNNTYSGTLTPNNNSYRLGGGGGTLTVSSALTGIARSLTVNGNVTLSGAISYGNNTTVNAGTLQMNSTNTCSEIGRIVTIAATGATLNLNFTGTNKVEQLFIGTLEKAKGVYGTGAIVLPQLTGSGKLEVVGPPPPGTMNIID